MPEYGNWCKVQTLRAAIAAPPVDAPVEALAEVYTAARRLAQDAYTSRKPEAEELAERLLYEIHVGTCYASPTGVLLADDRNDDHRDTVSHDRLDFCNRNPVVQFHGSL